MVDGEKRVIVHIEERKPIVLRAEALKACAGEDTVSTYTAGVRELFK